LTLPALLAVRARIPSAAGDAQVAVEQTTDPAAPNMDRRPLPKHALLRTGSSAFRTRGFLARIAFSPDGRTIAAADGSGSTPRVTVFDVETGREIKQLVAPGGPKDRVSSVVYSPDGSRLVWGEYGGKVALWDPVRDRLLFHEKLHEAGVNDVLFSADGALLASAGDDSIRVRDVANPAAGPRELTPRQRPGGGGPDLANPGGAPIGIGGCQCLALSPDGTILVAGSTSDATLRVWRIRDSQLLLVIPDALGPGERLVRLFSVSVTPDGRRIVAVGQCRVTRDPSKPQPGPPYTFNSEVWIWDIATGERLSDYRASEGTGLGLAAFSPDRTLVAVCDPGLLQLIETETGRARQAIPSVGWGWTPAFSPDGKLVGLPHINTIELFEVSTGRQLHRDASTPVGYAHRAAWSPSGDRVVTGDSDGFIRVRDAETARLIWQTSLAPVIQRGGWYAQPVFVSYSRDGQLVLAAACRDSPLPSESGIIQILDAATGRMVREIPLKTILQSAALAPDERMMVVALSHRGGGTVQWVGVEVATGRTRWANPHEGDPNGLSRPFALQFTAHSPWLVAALADGNVIRFNALSGHEDRRFLADWRNREQRNAGKPRIPYMGRAAFSNDGSTLVFLQLGWMYVWDVGSGTVRRKIRHPHPDGACLALAPDGHTLAISSTQSTGGPGPDAVRLYDIERGEPIVKFQPDDGYACAMAFSPDGSRLFTGLSRGTGLFWTVPCERA
jgi:WD40 repeat protein